MLITLCTWTLRVEVSVCACMCIPGISGPPHTCWPRSLSLSWTPGPSGNFFFEGWGGVSQAISRRSRGPIRWFSARFSARAQGCSAVRALRAVHGASRAAPRGVWGTMWVLGIWLQLITCKISTFRCLAIFSSPWWWFLGLNPTLLVLIPSQSCYLPHDASERFATLGAKHFKEKKTCS